MFTQKICISAALLCAMHLACASEGGGSSYPQGVENFLSGALPPPGLYGLVYANDYSADRLNDQDGNNLNVPGFKVHANAIVPRLVWVADTKVLGGDVVLHAIVPLMDLKVSAGGTTQSKSGLGDITLGAGLAYHHSPKLHSIPALNVTFPTGGYTQGDLANIGRNYSAVEAMYAVSYVDPNGFNGDIRLGYLFNQRNKATDYQSGQEFHFDYAVGWGLGNGWTAGLGGYYKQQTTLDKQAGAELANSKSSGMAIGPSVKYDSGKGWFLTAKWQVESHVKNGSQGHALWLKAIFPL
jgi:hypothetical protein